MLKQDIVKLFITKNGINKDIVDNITILNGEYFELLLECKNIAFNKIFELQDEIEKEKLFNIFYENKNTLLKIGIFNNINSIAKKNKRSVREEIFHQKILVFIDIFKYKFDLFEYAFNTMIVGFCLLTIRNQDFTFLKIFIAVLFLILIIMSFYFKNDTKKNIDNKIKAYKTLCQIENEMLD